MKPTSGLHERGKFSLVVLAAFLIATLIGCGLPPGTRAYTMVGQSMKPALVEGQQFLTEPVRIDQLKRGDIIVYKDPENGTEHAKRVIGLPGDAIELKDSAVWLNGQKLDEPYLEAGTTTERIDGFADSWSVGTKEVFILGDMRSFSKDSRMFGPLDATRIMGRLKR